MAAYNHEHERRRLHEPGIKNASKSVKGNIWGLLAERTGTLHSFTIKTDNGNITSAPGYEHRGGLVKSYEKSEKEAGTDQLVERYRIETAGYEEAEKLFFELPYYSTVLLLSPAPEKIPQELKEQGYEGQSMAYFYHILPGEEKDRRVIKSLTWANHFDLEDQAKILNHFLGEGVVEESEESILLHPVGNCVFTQNTQSLRLLWDKIAEGYAEKDRKFILPPYRLIEEYLLNGRELQKNKHRVLSIMIDEIARLKVEGVADDELEHKWAIMLNLADQELLHKDISEQAPPVEYVWPVAYRFDDRMYDSDPLLVFEHHQHLNYTPRTVASHCGTSGGIGDNGVDSLLTSLTTRTFEAEKLYSSTDETSEPFKCPKCKKETHGRVGNSCPSCGITKEEAKKKGLVVCD